jgi:hypothetical protein
MTADVSAVQAEPEFAVPRWLRILLLLVALSELLGGVMALPAVVVNWTETSTAGLGGWIIRVYIALRPVLALAALVYLSKGWPQPALYCLASIALLEWANMMPSVALHGLQIQEGDAVWRIAFIFEIFIKPAVAVATAVLAALRSKPIVASLLAAAPTIFGWIGVIAFAAFVAVHGF